jgi:anthranilate synthase component 1
VPGVESERKKLETILQKKDVPQFEFATIGTEQTNLTDEQYIEHVKKGIAHCQRGDVFQVVLSKQFSQKFIGDDFNVYRALRSINPSPYLFYFDYGSYRLFGSSPESQLIVTDGSAIIHPIAGTVRKTGHKEEDDAATAALLTDAKENAEHTMLVDLARNDLSVYSDDVSVVHYKTVKQFSHLVHLVSEIQATLRSDVSTLQVFGKSFPAGTLSGAPKYKAMQIINELEQTPRGFYGGAIGYFGFNGNANMAIMIRSFRSEGNCLYYQAGAGIVVKSIPTNELQEVNNKVAALRSAIVLANKKLK